MWSVLLSVDYFGRGGYIISRAWMLFSPFFVSWHVLVMRAVLWSSAPHRSRHRPNKTVPPGHDGSDFFYRFSSHPISWLLAYLRSFATRLLSYPYLPAPRPATLDTKDGEVHGCDTADGERLDDCVLAHAITDDGGERLGWRYRCLLDFMRAMLSISHEMMRRRDAIPGRGVLSDFARPPLTRFSRSACLNCSPAPGRRDEPADVGLRLRA